MLGLLFLIIFDASALTLSADFRSKMFLYKFNEVFVILALIGAGLYVLLLISVILIKGRKIFGEFSILNFKIK